MRVCQKLHTTSQYDFRLRLSYNKSYRVWDALNPMMTCFYKITMFDLFKTDKDLLSLALKPSIDTKGFNAISILGDK